VKTLTYWSPECLTASPHHEHRWTNRGNNYRLLPYNFFRLKLWDHYSESYQIFTRCAEMNCRLTCWNPNCDIRMRFRTPVCQMNENREISATSQHNFHFLVHFNSKTTGPISTIFSNGVEQLLELLMRISARRWCISLQNTRAKSQDSHFWRLQKSPKINWLSQQRPLD